MEQKWEIGGPRRVEVDPGGRRRDRDRRDAETSVHEAAAARTFKPGIETMSVKALARERDEQAKAKQPKDPKGLRCTILCQETGEAELAELPAAAKAVVRTFELFMARVVRYQHPTGSY